MKHFYAVLFSLSLFLFPFTSFAQEMSQGQKIEIEKDDLRDRVYSVRIKDNTFGGGVNFSFSAPQITTRSSLILDYKELAKQYLATYGGHFGITDVATQFFEGEVTVDNFGMAHVRFPQAYQGVAVTNGEMIVHIRSNGALKTINGIFIKGLSGLNATPSITEGEATAVAASYWQLKYGVSYEVDDIALVIISPSELKNKDGKSYLSWRIRLRNDGEFLDENVFIDAHTANYITYESNIRAAHGEKTPIFRRVAELAPDGQWWLNGVFPEYPGYVFGRLEGRPARGPNPYVNDGKGSGPDTVYTRLNQVHKFFQNELGINGPDGNGGIFVAESGIAKGKNVTDAYTDITWCPSNGMFSNKLHFMFCGYSKLEDLIGHEYAHAVGWGTLKYAGESGAIEEAISDLTGYRFQKYLTGSTDWVCETQTEDELPFRNSKTPGVGTLDPSPVHWYDSNTDCSRMHIMSTVASHAAYLASEGGEREGCKVRAVGIERVHNVWFHAKLNYFPSTVTYNSSISYIMDACDDLYPNTVNPEEFNPICYQIKKSMLATKMDQRGYCNDKRKIYERAPSCDFCPDNPNKDDIGCSGNCDGEADLDSDGDGTPDCYDECPNDPDKVTAGRCGCGVPEDIVDLDDDTFWGAGSCPAIRNDCDDTKFDNTAPGEPEICGDNIDNDCDGLTDEGCEEEEPKPDPNYTEIISRLQGGSGYSNSPDISGDGRYIVFSSSGKMLGVTEPLKNLNVFLYDTKLNTYTLISKDNNGLELNGDAFNSRISKKGETVVFQLDTPPNKNGVSTSKIFVWRKEKGLLLLTNHGYRPSVSPDGRYVTYDVKEEEKNGGYNAVYIWDAEKKGVTGEIDPPSRVIENTPEKLVNGNSFSSEVSATGKYVVFCSDATNLVDEDKDGEKIFVRNMISKEIELVARLRKGSSKVCPAITIAISDDGRYITYSGLLASNTYAAAHIYLWDRDKYSNRDERDRWIDKTTLIDTEYAESGKTSFASSGASYDPNISGDGRYITFRSSATNLVESGSIGNLPKIFLYDKDTSKIELISTGLNGAIPNGAPLKSGVSDDGSIIVFDSRASNLVESILDINGQGEDVFAVYRDVCPEDPDKYSVGECGCGVPDTDSDGNGIADCNEESTSTLDEDEEGFLDECPYDPAKVFPGICGCGVPDTDSDGDGTPDCNDKCPNDPKKTEPGICGCGVSDIDTDKDGTPDCKDLCPKDPKKVSAGICGCGVPDIDSDKDGVPDCKDKCPKDPKKITAGVCGCGVPDIDTDKDGTPDCNDKCPNDPKKTKPGICGCGIPDIDSDKDGVPDCKDKCPKDPKKITAGVCGCGVPDIDTDKDGTPDCKDLCPKDPKKVSAGICGCGVPDIDSDKDGVPDCKDKCPNDPKKTLPGICGCGVSDIDSNKDGIPDCLGTPERDRCPNDPNKTDPGVCGCGRPDTDSDGDGTPDCKDQCPKDPNKTKPGVCGCGKPDIDSDGDGVLDCRDKCPNDPKKTQPGRCGCGVADIDTDRDGVLDCFDGCPSNPKKTKPDEWGCAVTDRDSDRDGIPDIFDGCPYDPNKSAPQICGCGVVDSAKNIADDDKDGVAACNDVCPLEPDALTQEGPSTTPVWFKDGIQNIADFKDIFVNIGDLNRDGHDDVALVQPLTQKGSVLASVSIYYGGVKGISSKSPTLLNQYGATQNVVSSVIKGGDINGDGYGDVIVIDQKSKGRIFVYYGSSSGVRSTPASVINNTKYITDLTVFSAGDINGDGYSDVVVSSKSFGVHVYYGRTAGLPNTPNDIIPTEKVLQIAAAKPAGDLNNDGYDDLIAYGRYNGTYKGEGGRVLQNPSFIAIYLGSYTGITKTPSEVYVLENLYHVSAIGDVNGDGYGDVAVNYGDSKLTGTGRQGLVSIFYSKSSKVFRKPAITLGREISEGADYFDFGAVLPTITGDFNGDTYPDIVITTKDFVFIYYGGSNGVKATPALILDYKEKHSSSLSSINSIDVPDLNGDGFSDLILTGLNLKGKELRAEAFLGGNLRSGPTVKPCGEGDEEDQDDASSSGADEPEDVLTCSDSDGGKNKMVSGVTRYRNLTFKDRCSSKKLLIEYFCNPAGFPTLQLFHCKNGCEAGACKTVQTLKLSKKQRRKQRKQRRLFRKSLQSYIGVQ